MPRYRKKPIVVDTFQWQGPGTPRPGWFKAAVASGKIRSGGAGWSRRPALFIDMPKETMQIYAGDWVVRGAKGELSKVEADEFAATYEEVK